MDDNLIDQLAKKIIKHLSESGKDDVEKVCWMIIHEYHHGLMPFEYDIREIDETLYLAVLKSTRVMLEN